MISEIIIMEPNSLLVYITIMAVAFSIWIARDRKRNQYPRWYKKKEDEDD